MPCCEHDHVGRLGGDDFLVRCPNVPSLQDAVDIARRLAASQGTVAWLPCTDRTATSNRPSLAHDEFSPDETRRPRDQPCTRPSSPADARRHLSTFRESRGASPPLAAAW